MAIDDGPVVILIAVILKIRAQHVPTRYPGMRYEQAADCEPMANVVQRVEIRVVPNIVLRPRGVALQVVRVEFVLAVEVAFVRIVVTITRIRVVGGELDMLAQSSLNADRQTVVAGMTDRLVYVELAHLWVRPSDDGLEGLSGGIQEYRTGGIVVAGSRY